VKFPQGLFQLGTINRGIERPFTYQYVFVKFVLHRINKL